MPAIGRPGRRPLIGSSGKRRKTVPEGCPVTAIGSPRDGLRTDATRQLAVLHAAGVENPLVIATHELDALGPPLHVSQPEYLGARLGRELQEVARLEVLSEDIDCHGGDGTA